jgi:hypothetical protein
MVTCSHTGCLETSVAKGFCRTHYMRFKRHGDSNVSRPVGWGKKEKHELYDSWCWMRKMEGLHVVEPEWKNDFWKFVEHMGPKPSSKHRLCKKESSKGFTAGNLYWKEAIASTEDRSHYAREWRKANPDKTRRSDLKKYKISPEEFDEMFIKQSGLCAICGSNPETEGKVLYIDHCHSSGKVRGLLCQKCNTGLGVFLDTPKLLRQAANYLECANP